ncbi:glycosyltransferase [Mycobacterium sp. Marseille-P9652]|uniref:glycosyltransferase n=1 Tax=Mycobacterium sp. Marseille-P9652 TaxID=2654950 RepID=UPI0012E895FC|nr:glycosyltransferase [Mycobacterium sp. Marseille-P9652]
MSAPVFRSYDGAAVVIPAHHAAAQLPACLRAVLTAALCVPVPVVIVVVLDGSDDRSAQLAGEYGQDVHFIGVDVGNAGTARAVGFGYARSLLGDGAQCWYATIDAGRRVHPGWLVRQLEFGADMVWEDRLPGVDMGFSAHAYWRVGGFRTLGSGADSDLFTRFETAGYAVRRNSDLPAITSARTPARAPYGFAHRLGSPGRSVAGDCA